MEPKRCPNCTISFHRIRRESLTENQHILHLLRKWHPRRTISETDDICRACLYVIHNTVDVETLDKPVLGHCACCIMCGRSLIIRDKKVRSHKVSLDNEKEALLYNVISKLKLPCEIGPSAKVCHPCRQRACRMKKKEDDVMRESHSTNDTMTDKPETVRKTIRDTIILPNYKRSVMTDRCVFKRCEEASVHIPIRVRRDLLANYCYYLPAKCQICKNHLDKDKWEAVVDTGVNIFTAEYIEDMIEVLKSDYSRYD